MWSDIHQAKLKGGGDQFPSNLIEFFYHMAEGNPTDKRNKKYHPPFNSIFKLLPEKKCK